MLLTECILKKSYLKDLNPSVAIFGDRVSKKALKIKWGCKGGAQIQQDQCLMRRDTRKLTLSLSIPPASSPEQPPICFRSPWIYLFWLIWCKHDPSLSGKLSRFLHAVPCVRAVFPFCGQRTLHGANMSHASQPFSVDGYLGSFYLLAAMNSFKNLHKNTCFGFCFQVFRA